MIYVFSKDDMLEIAARLLKCDKSRIAVRQVPLFANRHFTTWVDDNESILPKKSNTVYYTGNISCSVSNNSLNVVAFHLGSTFPLTKLSLPFNTALRTADISDCFCENLDIIYMNESLAVENTPSDITLTGVYFEFSLI